MYQGFAKVALGCVAAAALVTPSWAGNSPEAPQAAAQESPYKDQGEYDLATAAQKETDPQKKLDRLKEWEQKYPDSKLKNERTLMQAQGLGGIALAGYGKTDPAALDASQKASQQIVDNLDSYFADAVKPASVTDAQWKGARHDFEVQAHSVLGWVAYVKKQDPTAETEFKKVLALNPGQAQVSYWLGGVIIRQKDLKRYPEALYDFARAVSVTGPTALPPAAKTPADDYLKKVYANYHGDTSGLDELKAAAGAAPTALPPADYHLESVTEIDIKNNVDTAVFNQKHPDIALWRQVREALKATDGDTYFGQVKGTQVPPEAIGMFKAKVITVNDKDIVVNVDSPLGDATLKFDSKLNSKVITVGEPIEFKGVVESYTKEPYMLTLKIEDPKEEIKGLPAGAFSGTAPARKAPARRAPAKK